MRYQIYVIVIMSQLVQFMVFSICYFVCIKIIRQIIAFVCLMQKVRLFVMIYIRNIKPIAHQCLMI